MRCMHEAELHEENCFGTLTYEDAFLPQFGSLDKRAFPLFMKRLRKDIWPRKVKYLMCGEYGSLGRPHYHFLLFGYAAAAEQLERWWSVKGKVMGFVTSGPLTVARARYVCHYVLKKTDVASGRRRYWNEDGVEIESEFALMSRGGRTGRGLGYGWYEKFGAEVQRMDSVVVEGAECMPPRYYDKLLAERDEVLAEVVKLRRMRKARVPGVRERLAREVILKRELQDIERRL